MRTAWGAFCFLWDPEGNPLQFYESAFIRPDADPERVPVRDPGTSPAAGRPQPDRSRDDPDRDRRRRRLVSRAVAAAGRASDGRPQRRRPGIASRRRHGDAERLAVPVAGRRRPPAPRAPIVIDPFLLKVLPASIKGAPLVENAEAEAHDLTDPALAGQASALAAALADRHDDQRLGYVSVVHLRVGVFSDAYFKSWRETYDSGACSQAGGVAQSSAETEIAGHKTFIGHCVGGVLTYHVHLSPADVIVSISALGDQRFGQLVVEGLR